MTHTSPREPKGRSLINIRPFSIEPGFNRYAEGSVLVKSGHTHVLCTASVEETVPAWLVGKGKGWVTAEYSMLPRSTHTRSRRDREKVSGRTHEIQRLIGRALRSMVDLRSLGERSIMVDCDVLQADGGTRTAAISGACVALAIALSKTAPKAWIDTVAAVSVGIKNGQVHVDLDYDEDSTCDVDMNFVVTGKGHFIEVQGTAEKQAFTRDDLNKMTDGAMAGVQQIRQAQTEILNSLNLMQS